MMRQNAEFLQIDVAEDRWESIIEYCSFDWMKRNATKSVPLGGAFWDAGAQLFINKGTNGRWRDELPADESPKYEQDARQELGPFWRRWLSYRTWGIVDIEFVGDALGFLGHKSFVEGGFLVGTAGCPSPV